MRDIPRSALILLSLLPAAPVQAQASRPRFEISFPAERSSAPLDGRLLLFISADTTEEPRFQVSDGPGTQQVFGVDVDGWRPGETRVINASAFGYPRRSLAELRRGNVSRASAHHRYETFRRSDGHVVKLPPDKGEGQQFSRKPGNLYSSPRSSCSTRARRRRAPFLNQGFRLSTTSRNRYEIHQIREDQSERLSNSGDATCTRCLVLLPWDSRSTPTHAIRSCHHGHFPSSVDGWRETPPDNAQARLQRAIHPPRYKSHSAGARRGSSTRTVEPGIPARAADRDSTRHALLR